MKTIDIKGKPYVMVNERILYFRDQDTFKGWQIVTEIITVDADNVVMKASIIDTDGTVVATGHGQEFSANGFINKTSYVENCETSAVGRALAMLGIGIEDSIATAEEVGNAIKQQEDKRPWLNHATFNKAVQGMNTISDDAERKAAYEHLDKTYKMKREYRSQLLEIVEQQDIKI